MEDDESVGVASGFLFGRANGKQQFVTGELVAFLEFLDPGPVGFEFFAPHRALLAAARQAAGQDVKFAVAVQEFDVDVVFDLLPFLGGEADRHGAQPLSCSIKLARRPNMSRTRLDPSEGWQGSSRNRWKIVENSDPQSDL
jgi:hypothetical protein